MTNKKIITAENTDFSERLQTAKVRYSIVIPTFNRPSSLSRAIESVLSQEYSNFEIIVGDDASKDDTQKIIRDIRDIRIRYFRNTANCGLSAVRNAAVNIARGEFIIFMDDDSALKENFLEKLEEITAKYNSDVLCPRILDPQTNEPFIDFFLNTKDKYLGFFEFNHFLGGGHIFNRKIIKIVGFYDERFGVGSRYGAAEESDYFFRMKKCGEKVLYCPELIIYHSKERDPSEEKVFSYSYAISAMLIKNLCSDLRHFYIYSAIITKRLAVSLLRTWQFYFFPRTIEEKNRIYKYRYFLKGTLSGIFNYFRLR